MSKVVWEIGPVKLANGFDAVIHRFCEKRQKYIGELQDGSGGWFAREWDANGWYCFRGKTAEDPYNLVPPPKKTIRVRGWLVVFANGKTLYFGYSDKDTAVTEANVRGFAVIPIDREVTEGDGLQ
jgi:hypothetical protein